MKAVAICIICLIVIGALYTRNTPVSYTMQFNSVLETVTNIGEVIDQLGEPIKVTKKVEFDRQIIEDAKNKGAETAYYWVNGMSSYHYVVTDIKGDVINYSSEGW